MQRTGLAVGRKTGKQHRSPLWHPRLAVPILGVLMMALAMACGSPDPTATPRPATPVPTAAPGQPTPTPAAATPTPAFDAAGYFSGRTVRVISPAAPGGGYDVFARMFAANASRHTPGNPRIIVENRIGSGLLVGLQVAMRAAPDGLTIGQLHPRWAQAEILGNDVEDFDLQRVKLLGSPTFAAASSMWCARRDVATSWDQMVNLGRQLTSGETAPGNSPGPEYVEAIGGPIRNVYGYGGTSEIMAAFDRNELEGTTRCGPETVLRLFPEWVDQEKFIPIFWYGVLNDQNREFAAQMGVTDLPYILDLTNPDAEQRQAFDTYVALVRAQRTFVMAPDVPDHIYDVWVQVFEDTVKDQGFIAAVQAAGYSDDYEYGSPQDIRAAFEIGLGLSPKARELLARMTGQ